MPVHTLSTNAVVSRTFAGAGRLDFVRQYDITWQMGKGRLVTIMLNSVHRAGTPTFFPSFHILLFVAVIGRLHHLRGTPLSQFCITHNLVRRSALRLQEKASCQGARILDANAKASKKAGQEASAEGCQGQEAQHHRPGQQGPAISTSPGYN